MTELEGYLQAVQLVPAVEGFLRQGSQVLLGERKRVSHGLGYGLLAGVGGKIGDSADTAAETAEQAIDREVMEEIGVRVIAKQEVARVRFIFAHKPVDSPWNQDVKVYMVSKWQGILAETESIRPAWYDIDNIPWARMWADSIFWLPDVFAGRQVDATFLYRDDNTLAEYRVDLVG